LGESKKVLKIVPVDSKENLQYIRELFKEYTDSLGFDLSFQNFDKEFAELPGKYTPPEGRLLLAVDDDKIAGCVALRKFENDICEMKRLYVRPKFRRKGIGKALSIAVINSAKEIGYSAMRLDTVPWMKQAIELYHAMGFKDISSYRYNPIPGTVYMELELK
jgi:ribosomal protein S18 acetylase RimI-like enzyme